MLKLNQLSNPNKCLLKKQFQIQKEENIYENNLNLNKKTNAKKKINKNSNKPQIKNNNKSKENFYFESENIKENFQIQNQSQIEKTDKWTESSVS